MRAQKCSRGNLAPNPFLFSRWVNWYLEKLTCLIFFQDKIGMQRKPGLGGSRDKGSVSDWKRNISKWFFKQRKPKRIVGPKCGAREVEIRDMETESDQRECQEQWDPHSAVKSICITEAWRDKAFPVSQESLTKNKVLDLLASCYTVVLTL